jgi:hypothetical protein
MGLSCSAGMTRWVRSALYAGSGCLPMTAEVTAAVLTARRTTQHIRLSTPDDAYERLCILTIPPSLGPSPPYAGRYTVSSRFWCHSCECGYIVRGLRTVCCLAAPTS